jgi:branched-chain amino acid transport system substrate-binding protein
MRRSTKLFAVVAILATVAAGCAKKTPSGTGSSSPPAASCSSTSLKGFAAGATRNSNATFTAAGFTAQAAKPVYKIGMFGDLTGSASALVIPIRNAAQLAVDQANASGKASDGTALNATIQLVVKDNKDHLATTAPPIEQAFIDDSKVLGVIGGAFSGETNAVGGKFKAAGLTHISASATDPTITSHGWPFFRAVVSDAVQGKKMADVIAATGCKSVAVIDDKEPYGQGLADAVKAELTAKGVTVVDREAVAATVTDYSTLIDTISAKKPDAVFYGGYYNTAGLLLKQMRERGLNTLFTCGDGCADAQLITVATAADATNVFVTCPCVIPFFAAAGTKAAQLQADYKAKYGINALIYSSEAYDAANIFIAAIAHGAATRAAVLAFVKGLNNFPGVSRNYTFQANGELSTASQLINVYPVKNGALELLGTTEQAIG